MTGASLLDELVAACPGGGAGHAGEADELDGVPARFVARPRSTAEVAALLALAARRGLVVAARSGGTKADWGRPPRALDLLVDCSGMDRILEHAVGDLVVRAEAGTRLADLQGALAPHQQWLPVDEVVPGSSLGGIVATGCSGPSRLAYGAVRDLLIGVTVVRADGVVARAGGKVVKNVAGYDLAKLFTGSLGTLGIVTEVTFRLRPVAPARRFVTTEVAEDDLDHLLPALRRLPVAFAALELERAEDGHHVVTALLEGRPGPLEERCRTLVAALPAARVASAPPASWTSLPGPVTLTATTALSGLPRLVADAGRLAEAAGLAMHLTASAGLGIVRLGLDDSAPADAVASLLASLRARDTSDGGSTRLVRGPARLRAGLDPWGEVPGLRLMEQIKDRFDPERRLSPGRFVGGI